MKLKEDKLTEIRNNLEELLNDLEAASIKGTKMHKVEGNIFRHLLKMGLKLLEYYVMLASQVVSELGHPKDDVGRNYQNKGQKKRSYMSIFGLLTLDRPKYYSPISKTHYVLDSWLGLPEGRYSYVLSDLAFLWFCGVGFCPERSAVGAHLRSSACRHAG